MKLLLTCFVKPEILIVITFEHQTKNQKRNAIKYLDLDAANRPGDTDSDLVASKYCTRPGLNFKMG